MPARVSSYMTSDVITVGPTDTLAHARRLMLQHGVNRLVVVENNRPVGMLTITDIVNALLGKFMGVPLDGIYVSQVMTRNPKTIRITQTIKTAAQLMHRFRIGGLPVISHDDRLAGIVTRTDIVKAFSDKGANMFTVGQVMRKEVAVVRPEHHLLYVANRVQADPAGKVVVVDNNKRPIGIITKRDLAFITLPPSFTRRRREKMRKRKVVNPLTEKLVQVRVYPIQVAEDIMTTDVRVTRPQTDLADAAAIMYENGIGSLPVVDEEGSLIGIVTKMEIVEVVAKFL